VKFEILPFISKFLNFKALAFQKGVLFLGLHLIILVPIS